MSDSVNENQKIKLDIVSDVMCPWCIVGYKRLEAAINELGIQDKIDIEWQPFELNPDMPAEGENLRDHLMRKYGSSAEDSAKVRDNITAMGAEYGFEFNYTDDMRVVNTRDAHILLGYAFEQGAFEQGLQHALKQRLFTAFFTEGKDVSKREVLLAEAQAVGLDLAGVTQVLDDAKRRSQVEENELTWQQRGISGVPTVVFNRTSAITGAHPQSTYKQVLQELLAD